MNDSRCAGAGTGLYERLLRRVVLALDEADTAGWLRDEHPAELELKGLSLAELGLIRAYLKQDTSWLRGWQDAAEATARGDSRKSPSPNAARLALPVLRPVASPRSR